MLEIPRFHNSSLLHRAFVHRSYMNEYPEETENNERLEFLGDALLGFLIGSLLYDHYPQMDEGRLTKLRSALVNEQQLAKFAKKMSLGQQMLLGKGTELGGGRNNLNLLSSTFEAVIGAYYLDSGFEAVRDFIKPIFLESAKRNVDYQLNENYIGMLQERSVRELGEEPKYDLVDESGADNDKEFIFKVCIKGKKHGIGEGRKKQEAKKRAAENALKSLGWL
jgi:ribonuclease III